MTSLWEVLNGSTHTMYPPQICDDSNWPGRIKKRIRKRCVWIKKTFTMNSNDTVPDVRSFWHRSLIDNFWWNKFWCAIFAVLSLVGCDLHRVAEVTDSYLITVGVCHEDVIRLKKQWKYSFFSNLPSEYILYYHLLNLKARTVPVQFWILICIVYTSKRRKWKSKSLKIHQYIP